MQLNLTFNPEPARYTGTNADNAKIAYAAVNGARDCLSLAYVSKPARNINKIINNAELPLGVEVQ